MLITKKSSVLIIIRFRLINLSQFNMFECRQSHRLFQVSFSTSMRFIYNLFSLL